MPETEVEKKMREARESLEKDKKEEIAQGEAANTGSLVRDVTEEEQEAFRAMFPGNQ